MSLGCGPSSETDAGIRRDAGPAVDAGPTPFWPGTLPSTEALGTRRGRTIARSTIHVHSPLSHDACDGAGWIAGELAAPECLARFRAAMCALHLDAVMMTDHSPHVNEVTFEQALWIQAGDEAVTVGGEIVANRMACPDGHRVLLTVGSENTHMPIALSRHPGDPSDPDALGDVYDGTDAASIAAWRAAGGLVWQAHTEGRTVEQLRATNLDGLELYNLHANLDPGIREELLGLEPASYVSDFLFFTRPAFRLPADLAVMAFLEVNRVGLDRWDTLLAEGLHIAGSGGCDAHENALPMLLSDGERADSYRRMMYWIENHLLVDEVSLDGVRDALGEGRFYVTSEVFGSPLDFDFTATNMAGDIAEMGETVPVGSTLQITAPHLPAEIPQELPPIVSVHLIRAQDGGGVEVLTGPGDLELLTTEAGAYRVEVRMVPEHTRRVLGTRADSLIHEIVWVYSNPIFVE